MIPISVIVVLIVMATSYSQVDKGSGVRNTIAESYVKLVLEVGKYDPVYVDFYIGPKEWKLPEVPAEKKAFPSGQLIAKVNNLIDQLGLVDKAKLRGLQVLRYDFLQKQLVSVRGKIELLSGKKMSFDEESRALYDAVAPPFDKAYCDSLLHELDRLLPDTGSVPARLDKYLSRFRVPKEKIDTVFTAALSEARRRTKEFIELPPYENVKVEYVTNKPWGAYNGFLGNSRSLIQINTDWPFRIYQILNLACHEVYPGHHVHVTLLEMNLLQDSNWVEFSVGPLFSPFSVISEGVASYAIELAFPEEDRVAFEKRVLFPLAELDTAEVDRYSEVERIISKLAPAENQVARDFIDGKIGKKEAEDWLVQLAICPPDEAAHEVEFYKAYRSYIITYSVGKQLVRDYVEKKDGFFKDVKKRWVSLYQLLTTPRTPSSLK
jgi:hypothetical protein